MIACLHQDAEIWCWAHVPEIRHEFVFGRIVGVFHGPTSGPGERLLAVRLPRIADDGGGRIAPDEAEHPGLRVGLVRYRDPGSELP